MSGCVCVYVSVHVCVCVVLEYSMLRNRFLSHSKRIDASKDCVHAALHA